MLRCNARLRRCSAPIERLIVTTNAVPPRALVLASAQTSCMLAESVQRRRREEMKTG